jgi:protein SCO1/2
MKTSFLIPALAMMLTFQSRAGAVPQARDGPRSVDPISARSIYQLDAAWTDEAGESFRLASLRGHPVVIAMIFTSCGSACPVTVGQMKELEQALSKSMRAETRFVLVSFDSEGDTPSVLHSYLLHSGLDSRRWVLLHGNPGQVRDLAMVLGVSYSQVGPGLFSHSSLVSVLNRNGEIAYQRANLQGIVAEAAQAVSAAR